MLIEFHCDACGRTLRAGEGTAGRRVLCPGCGTFAMVPATEPDRGAESADEEGGTSAAGPPFAPPPPPPILDLPPPPPPDWPPPGVEAGSPFLAEPVEPIESDNPYQAPTQYGAHEAPPPYVGPVAPIDARAVLSLVLGTCGFLFLWCPPLGLPIGGTGLVLGVVALNSPNRGLAIAGIILASIQVALALLFLLFFFVGLVAWH